MTLTQATQVPTVADFPTATLVLAGPWRRAVQLERRPAIVVGPFGCPESVEDASMAVVWFFSDGAPEPGPTVQAMFPRELTPIDDTLTTMHPDAFRDIARSLRAKAASPTTMATSCATRYVRHGASAPG